MADNLLSRTQPGHAGDHELAHFAVGSLWFLHLHAGVRVGRRVRERERGNVRQDAWVRHHALASWLANAPTCHCRCCHAPPELPPGRDYDWMDLLTFGLADGRPPDDPRGPLSGTLRMVRDVLNKNQR